MEIDISEGTISCHAYGNLRYGGQNMVLVIDQGTTLSMWL